jgi:magnesium-transporting ATPase (P-type)
MDGREAKVKAVGATLENDLIVLGALAIEDELQPNVPETIAFLAEMGIKLWVLTGDKHETAVSIARSTHVITPDCHVVELPTGGDQECQRALDEVAAHDLTVLVVSPNSLQFLTTERPTSLTALRSVAARSSATECHLSLRAASSEPFNRAERRDASRSATVPMTCM